MQGRLRYLPEVLSAKYGSKYSKQLGMNHRCINFLWSGWEAPSVNTEIPPYNTQRV